MTAATITLIAALLTFGGGMVGLLYDKLLPEHQVSDETRALINRVTGLVATMAALVLGLLIDPLIAFTTARKATWKSYRGASSNSTAYCGTTDPTRSLHETCSRPR